MSIWHPISASSFQNGKVNTPPFSKSLFSSYFSTNFVCVVLNDRSGRLSQKIFSGHEPNGITVFVNSILKLRCLINRTRVHDRLSSIYGRTRSHCWTPPPGANSSTEFVVQLVIIVRFVLVGGWRCSLPSNAFFFSFLPLEEWFDKSMWVTKLSSRRNILHIYKTMNSYEAKWVIFLRDTFYENMPPSVLRDCWIYRMLYHRIYHCPDDSGQTDSFDGHNSQYTILHQVQRAVNHMQGVNSSRSNI